MIFYHSSLGDIPRATKKTLFTRTVLMILTNPHKTSVAWSKKKASIDDLVGESAGQRYSLLLHTSILIYI